MGDGVDQLRHGGQLLRLPQRHFGALTFSHILADAKNTSIPSDSHRLQWSAAPFNFAHLSALGSPGVLMGLAHVRRVEILETTRHYGTPLIGEEQFRDRLSLYLRLTIPGHFLTVFVEQQYAPFRISQNYQAGTCADNGVQEPLPLQQPLQLVDDPDAD